jgi:pimeloyl-ACP methyl ester carboxylesterase
MEQHLRAAHPDWSNDGVAASLANFETRPDGTIRPWLTRDRHMRVLRALWEHRPTADLARITVRAMLVMADTGDEWAANKGAEAARAVAAKPDLDVRWFSPADHDVHVQHPDELAELFDQRF